MQTTNEIADLIDQIQDKIGRNIDDEDVKALGELLEKHYLMDLNLVGDFIADGVFVCDRYGTILYVNSANERMCGISADECVGHNIAEFTTDGNGLQNVVVKQVLETGEPYSSIVTSQKTGVQMLEICSPIRNSNGTLMGCIVIDKDINLTTSLTEKLRLSQSKVAAYEAVNEQNTRVIELLNHQVCTDVLISESSEVKHAYMLALQVAQTDVTVLISGETGTGKEVIANYIFENSIRKKSPFIKVNCAAIPYNLLESELFGYEKGAFTGAGSKGKPGMFELANGGTIFLDEIGELPIEFQAKLLRAIQHQEINRIGGTKTIKLDVRILAATNKDLKDMVDKGTFREDLFYRLNIYPVNVPALRNRTEDIPLFAEYFLNLFNKKYKKNIILDREVIYKLCRYEWPGNIRELENVIERWVVIYEAYTIISWDMIGNYFSHSTADLQQTQFDGLTYKAFMEGHEREILTWAHKKYKTTREMAKVLKIDHSTIVRKGKALGLNFKDSKYL